MRGKCGDKKFGAFGNFYPPSLLYLYVITRMGLPGFS